MSHAAGSMPRSVVIGVGNPVLTDDGAGIRAAELLRRVIEPGEPVDVIDVWAGGLRLMEAMVGYERAVVIDAMVSGRVEPGTVVELEVADLPATRNLNCLHDTNLPVALELGREAGVQLPATIRIFGIEALDVSTFSERLTEPVEAGLPGLMGRVMDALRRDAGGHREDRPVLL